MARVLLLVLVFGIAGCEKSHPAPAVVDDTTERLREAEYQAEQTAKKLAALESKLAAEKKAEADAARDEQKEQARIMAAQAEAAGRIAELQQKQQRDEIYQSLTADERTRFDTVEAKIKVGNLDGISKNDVKWILNGPASDVLRESLLDAIAKFRPGPASRWSVIYKLAEHFELNSFGIALIESDIGLMARLQGFKAATERGDILTDEQIKQYRESEIVRPLLAEYLKKQAGNN